MQSQGTRKSNFPGQTTILSGAYFDYVVNGVNYRISADNMIDAFGTTGSIVQVGDSACVPVLDDQGLVKGIRNIRAGFGVAVIIDPTECIEISTNFSFNEVGVPLVDDPDASAAIFRSLVAGGGISIGGSAGQIQITATGTPASTKTVIVSQKSDLPTPITGVINLAANTEYLFVDDVDLVTDRLALNGNVVSADDDSLVQLTYTGTGDMFTCTGGSNNKIKDIRLSAASGDLFNIDGGGTGIFQLINITIADAKNLGVLNNLVGIQISNIIVETFTVGGFLFTGSNGVFLSIGTLLNVPVGTMFDLGTATFTGFSLVNSFPNVSAGATFISGEADSDNINVGGFGTIANVIQSGAGDALSGISNNDVQWQFTLNNKIPDTRPDSLLSMNTPTVTTITTIDTPFLVEGVWTDELSSQFTVTAAGRATYNGVKDAVLPVSISTTIEAVSGTNKDITIHLFLNGVVVSDAFTPNRVSSGDPKNTSIMWQLNFEPGDYIELFIENNTDAVNLSVNKASIRIN